MASSTAGVTVSTAVPGMSVDGSVAVMVAAPVATPVARPWGEIVAVAVLDDDQVTLEVTLSVVRLEYVPVAVYCSVWPTPRDCTGGVTVMEIRTGDTPRAWADTAMPEVMMAKARRTDKRRAAPRNHDGRLRWSNVLTPYTMRCDAPRKHRTRVKVVATGQIPGANG